MRIDPSAAGPGTSRDTFTASAKVTVASASEPDQLVPQRRPVTTVERHATDRLFAERRPAPWAGVEAEGLPTFRWGIPSTDEEPSVIPVGRP